MSTIENLAKVEKKLRPLVTKLLSYERCVRLYSSGRTRFHKGLVFDIPKLNDVPTELSRTLWNLEFRSPILNAAGMFKNGEGSELSYAQGAGAYLAGTTTALARPGNEKEGCKHPFVPYPLSSASSNWLGLPNKGHLKVAAQIARLGKKPGFPLGVSLGALPDQDGEDAMSYLVAGLKAYEEAGVDFMEINESCPNTGEDVLETSGLSERLAYVAENFLEKRERELPLIVKFSPDTELSQLEELLPLLLSLGFDGVNFGNTSTNYEAIDSQIKESERGLFRYFTTAFGGGLGGLPVRKPSLELVKKAKRIIDEQLKKNPKLQEFHIIHTGGIHTGADVKASLEAGASLTQWYTGYFSAFAENGHELYSKLYRELLSL